MTSKRPIQGFTLIEIMIVVAVIGILAAIALPAYQDYTVRSKVSEGIGFASAAKVAVVSAYSNRGLPGTNAEAGLAEPEEINSQYVKSVKIEKDETDEKKGKIRVTFNDTIPQLTDKSVILAATERGSTIDWCCYSENIEARYMPASCRDNARCGSDPENGDSDDDSKDDSDGSNDDDSEDGGKDDGDDNTTTCPPPLTPTGNSGMCKLPAGQVNCPDGWSRTGKGQNCKKSG